MGTALFKSSPGDSKAMSCSGNSTPEHLQEPRPRTPEASSHGDLQPDPRETKLKGHTLAESVTFLPFLGANDQILLSPCECHTTFGQG